MSPVTRELVIVGAGPAGVSAALWAKSRHLDVMLVERAERPGGQLHDIFFEPREIAGWRGGNGEALADTLALQLAETGVPVRYAASVESLRAEGGVMLQIAGGETLHARAVLVASGARKRRLGVPGESTLEDRGVSFSATRDRDRLAGRATVVVGGGDAAAENALLLAALGGPVTVLARDALRARSEFRERLAREPRIRVLEHTRVLRIEGEDHVRAVRTLGPAGEAELACEGVVVKVGVVPNSEWCRDALAHDAEGFLRVDEQLATSQPGVWAAGDVVGPRLLSVPVAAGQGALAVAAIRAALRGA